MARDSVVLLFDIGATRTRLALATDADQFAEILTFETDPSTNGIKALIVKIRGLIKERSLAGIVGGIAGQINRQTAILFHATNLPHWNGIAIGKLLSQAFDCAVIIENDTSVVGLGEAVFGAGKGYKIVMYETVSTGVNAARITAGVIDANAHGTEVGAQLILGPDGTLTSLEAATGGAALERRFGCPPRELALQGLWRSEAKLLAFGLFNSLLHFSPDVVIFGGSMMHDIEISDIQSELMKLPRIWPAPIKLIPASLSDNGGLFGALALAQQHKFV
jgi:predicted NBD/HSP70 family sugar kinase